MANDRTVRIEDSRSTEVAKGKVVDDSERFGASRRHLRTIADPLRDPLAAKCSNSITNIKSELLFSYRRLHNAVD